MKASLEETVTSHEIDFVKVNDALELSLEIKHALLDKIAKLKLFMVNSVRSINSLKRATSSLKGSL